MSSNDDFGLPRWLRVKKKYGKIHAIAKWLSEEALQIAEKRREAKGKGERERYIQLNVEFQRITEIGRSS